MASPAQVSQLVLQVDAQVAVAQRSLQDLARVVKQSAGDMNSALDTTVQAHGRLNGAFNSARLAQMELSHVIRASVDDYAAGASPLRIMTLEMSRLAEAAELMGGGGGALGKLGSFMSGPWGIAVLLGASVLGQLFTKMSEGGESVSTLVDKMRQQAKQAQDSKAADEIWANSIDGLIERNQKLIDTLQKRLKAEEDLDLQQLESAKRDEARAQQELAAAQTRLANLRAEQAAQDRANATGGAGTRAGSLAPVGQSDVLASQIAQAAKDVATAQTAVAVARASIAENAITVGQDEGKALADLSAAAELWSKRYISALHGIEEANNQALAGSTGTITEGFSALEKAMKDAASAGIGTQFYNARTQAKNLGNELAAGKITAQQYADKMKALAASLEAAAEAAKNAKKGTGEFGKQISFADAEAIARSAGLTVTSGYRSVADQARLYNDPHYNHPGNPVARPGASAHNGVNGKWALDIAFGPGITAQSLKKIYGDQGVTLSAVYKESGHFHIEGSRSQAAAVDKRNAELANKQAGYDDFFQTQSAQLDAEILQARKQLVGDYGEQAQIAEGEIDAGTQRLKDAIAAKANEEIRAGLDAKIVNKQAGILAAKADELGSAKKAVIEHEKYVKSIEQAQKATDQTLGFQEDDLRFADEMAKSQADHRKLQLEIIDIEYQRKLALLESLKQIAASNNDSKEVDRLQGQIDRAGTEREQSVDRAYRGTMDPLQAWADQVPTDAKHINEALQSIEVQGIDNLASSIGEVITGTKSLGAAFKDISSQIISDIVQMTVKMLIFKALSSVFGNIGGGSGLGNSLYPVSGGVDPLAPRASGGPVAAGQPYVVGDRGVPELFVPNTNGVILPNVPKLNLSRANDNSGGPVEVHVLVDTSDDLMVKAAVVADQRIQAAAPRIVSSAARATVAAVSRKTLNGG